MRGKVLTQLNKHILDSFIWIWWVNAELVKIANIWGCLMYFYCSFMVRSNNTCKTPIILIIYYVHAHDNAISHSLRLFLCLGLS